MIIHQETSFAPLGKQTTDRGQDFYNVVKRMTKISCSLLFKRRRRRERRRIMNKKKDNPLFLNNHIVILSVLQFFFGRTMLSLLRASSVSHRITL